MTVISDRASLKCSQFSMSNWLISPASLPTRGFAGGGRNTMPPDEETAPMGSADAAAVLQ